MSFKYLHSNNWSAVPKHVIKALHSNDIHGVKVCDLPASHFLSGEQGLFATKSFKKFDIIGEYTGEVVSKDTGGHYVVALEDKPHNDSLGLDAEYVGN